VTAVINLPWLGSPTDELWEELLILSAKTKRVPWMLIGGQMMLLHTLEHGREPLQVSQDGDAIADIRARPDALLAFVRALESEDFESDGMSPDGRAHRYKHKTFDPPVLVGCTRPGQRRSARQPHDDTTRQDSRGSGRHPSPASG